MLANLIMAASIVCPCPAGQVAVPAPKQCFTTPCPQYDCVSVADALIVPKLLLPYQVGQGEQPDAQQGAQVGQ